MKRAQLSLEDHEWDRAYDFFEQVLSIEPENPRAYIGKLCTEVKVSSEEGLAECAYQITELNSYKRAMQFADERYRKTLEKYALTPEERRAAYSEEKEQQYKITLDRLELVKRRQDIKECKTLVDELEQLGDYNDSQLILREITNPIVGDDGLLKCALCGRGSQQPNRTMCWNCGIEFRRE